MECPGCGARIERTSGCDHMTCKTISYLFLFLLPSLRQATICYCWRMFTNEQRKVDVQDADSNSATCVARRIMGQKALEQKGILRMGKNADISRRGCRVISL